MVVTDCAQISEPVDSVNTRHLFYTTCVAMLRDTTSSVVPLSSIHADCELSYAFAILRVIVSVHALNIVGVSRGPVDSR